MAALTAVDASSGRSRQSCTRLTRGESGSRRRCGWSTRRTHSSRRWAGGSTPRASRSTHAWACRSTATGSTSS
eukprot:7233315-Prymnesium_polylepis.2